MADLPIKSPVTAAEPTLATHAATKNYVDTTKALTIANTRTASYTLVLGDANDAVEMNSTSATTVTIPPNSSVAFPLGTRVWITRMNTGTVTVAAGAGVTLRSPGNSVTARAQYSTICARKRGTDEWVLSEDLT